MEFGIQYTVDFNKICRICLSTQNLQPITGPVYSDQTNRATDANFFCVSIDYVLNKYAHIKFETVDKLPKQVCSRCYQHLSSAYSFLNHCNKMNTALMECLQRYENRLNIPSNEQHNHFEIIEDEIIKEEPEISNHSNVEDIKIAYEEIYAEKFPVIATCEYEPNVTNKSLSVEEPQKSTQSSSKEFQKPQKSNLNEFETDFETEIPITKIPAPLEAVYLPAVEDDPQVVIETFDENYNPNEGAEIEQHRNDQIDFVNKIQLASNDPNSDKFTDFQSSLLERWRQKQLKKRCKICWKQFKMSKKEFQIVDPSIKYCECSNARGTNVKALYKKNMRHYFE